MDFDDYEFMDMASPEVLSANDTAVTLNVKDLRWLALFPEDVIALAKHFKLTAHDIDCSEFKALQAYSDQADEDHFDECAKIRASVNNINKRIS